MYSSLDLFQVSSSMTRHAAVQQALIATNVANADTPGYRARSLPDFRESLNAMSPPSLRATRPGHIGGTLPSDGTAEPGGAEPAPNGNTVSLEEELLAAVEAQRQHGQALAIYRHAMGILRTSLGR